MLVNKMKREIWIKFQNAEAYHKEESRISSLLYEHQGDFDVVIYLNEERAKKILYGVTADSEDAKLLKNVFGEENVKLTEYEVACYEFNQDPDPVELFRDWLRYQKKLIAVAVEEGYTRQEAIEMLKIHQLDSIRDNIGGAY